MLLHPKNGIRMFPNLTKRQMRSFSGTGIKNQERASEPCADEQDVIFSCYEGGKGLIVLNRPKQLNTLNASMVCKIRNTLLEWQENKYFILLKGAGEKAFCAGGDVVEVVKDKSGEVGKRFFREEYLMDALISSLRFPFASIISGIVMGGGVGISLFGKYRIATETSLFAMPETQIGFFPDVGVSYYLSRMQKGLGNFLALTGYRLKGFDLIHAGIATHYCTTANLKELEESLLCNFQKSCCSTPDDIIREFHEKSLQSTKGCPPFTLAEHCENINSWFATCCLEETMDRICADKTRFAADLLECLKKQSPLSLKVTYKQMQEAKNLDIFDCLNVDYRIAMKMLKDSDFAEGVRALLIDKDKNPKWKHSDISKVTPEEVDAFFCPLSSDMELNLPNSLCLPCNP